MNEREFLKVLKGRASEQEKLIKSMPLPIVFSFISFYFGEHPWKILIPIALIITFILHSTLGNPYDEFILKLFGKL